MSVLPNSGSHNDSVVTTTPFDIFMLDRGSFAVKFIGEEAIDMGGVTKEFFSLVSEQMLDPQANLFLPQGPNNTFHPSPSSSVNGKPPESKVKTKLDYHKLYCELTYLHP